MKWKCKHLASRDTDATCSISVLQQMTILTVTSFTTHSLYYDFIILAGVGYGVCRAF